MTKYILFRAIFSIEDIMPSKNPKIIHENLRPHSRIQSPAFPETIEVITAHSLGNAVKIQGFGLTSGKSYKRILNETDLLELKISPESETFRGDAEKFRLAMEALRLGLAYEYDPYFSLSIARIDPLPHQLEAVYDHFLKLPRIRFLLADDPGAGKTIMAGLLIKELKIRGLIKRILIVSPANLIFQWQREMQEKFREHFDVVRGEVLRSSYGVNPWDEKDQVITSLPWISRIDDARDSLLKTRWDLVIVDEAHKMSAASEDNKTMSYQMGEKLSERADHYLLMTATPHKGDPENFRLFLSLLDKEVYGNIKSLENAMASREAPFYLRRVKEALVTFPDPDTGKSTSLFKKRLVSTVSFEIDDEEYDFYLDLTEYVERQSVRAARDDTVRGRALGFIMAMLQRRFASSIHAVRCSLERMRNKRQDILKDPEGYRQREIDRKLQKEIERRISGQNGDLGEISDDEREELLNQLEETVYSYDPDTLREDIRDLSKLIEKAKALEEREVETKLTKLREVLTRQGIFENPRMKLLIFTEHKDTLDYLVEKLRSWGLSVTQIHGGMKIGNRNEPGTRLYAEKEFRDDCQILVATEAAGEGINLQFCWFMINYDIPWNPVRLEQRMGRIHRYGQEKDCYIFNFVSTKTREGRVMQRLFDRIALIEEDLDPQHTGKIFNVLGDVFPSNQIEKKIRDMYARSLEEPEIIEWIVGETEQERFKQITNSTLEGLAKRELNLSAIVGKRDEAKERRLVPEVIADFFMKGAPHVGLKLKETQSGSKMYRVGKVPRLLLPYGEMLEKDYGTLGREYKEITFDKEVLKSYPNVEWATPGHPLFESVRSFAIDEGKESLEAGAVFYDLHRGSPTMLDVFSASVLDGLGKTVHKRLFVIENGENGKPVIRQPTVFLDLIPAPADTEVPDIDLPTHEESEGVLYALVLTDFLNEVAEERERQVATIAKHLTLSLNELIMRENLRLMDLTDRQAQGDPDPLLPANIKSSEIRLDDLNHRLNTRLDELQKERSLTLGDIVHCGRAWVLPHPDRDRPEYLGMRRDDEVERTAVDAVIRYEEGRGYVVESVELENRGFDLISRRFDTENPDVSTDVRFIEVKGRASIGDVFLTENEYRTATRLKNDYWLYVVYNCASTSEVRLIRDPVRLGWKPVVKVEHYQVGKDTIIMASKPEINNNS